MLPFKATLDLSRIDVVRKSAKGQKSAATSVVNIQIDLWLHFTFTTTRPMTTPHIESLILTS